MDNILRIWDFTMNNARRYSSQPAETNDSLDRTVITTFTIDTLPQKTAHVGGKDLPPHLFSQSFVTVGETAGPGKMAQALQSQREQAQALSWVKT